VVSRRDVGSKLLGLVLLIPLLLTGGCEVVCLGLTVLRMIIFVVDDGIEVR
jgi:hypothetical protein